MTGTNLSGQLEELFRETGEAHHQAYIETDGFDPECRSGTPTTCGRELVRSSVWSLPRASWSTC